MQIDYFFKNLTPNEKKWCEEYVATKIPQLEKLIHRQADDSASLRIKAEKFSTNSAYKITFDLKLPKQSFLVSEDDHTIVEAIDLAKDKLITQLKKLKR